MYTTSSLIVAIVWMLLLGWGFFALLKRHLRLDDLLAEKEAQLTIERHARSATDAHGRRRLASRSEVVVRPTELR